MESATSITSISTINPSLYTRRPQIQIRSFNYTRPLISPFKQSLSSKKSNRSFTKMVSDGYLSPGNTGFSSNTSSSYNTNKPYSVIDSCLVMPPSKGVNPRAIVKFLGGAFIGAVPEVTYGYLIEQLAKEGYVVILVPYNVTFDHANAANQVYERFNSCLDCVLSSGVPGSLTASQLVGLPVFSVGHSNGALLQVLTGSYFYDKIPKANAIISFNNRPATEAVPYFEQFGPLVNQMMPIVEASPVYSMARSASGDAWKMLIDTARAVLPESKRESLTSLTKFVDQLPSVLNQVTEGVSEFKPKPPENRELCRNSYNVPNTLLVKFKSDTIDESDLLEETLKPRIEAIGGTIEKVQLNGNHLTPCIQEPKWQVGYVYTPGDAIAQVLKSLSLSETRALYRTIVDWFRQFED